MDIIYNIMQDAAKQDGLAAVLRRLILITADVGDAAPCLVCGNAAYQLAIDLDNAMVAFVNAIETHKQLKQSRYV